MNALMLVHYVTVTPRVITNQAHTLVYATMAGRVMVITAPTLMNVNSVRTLASRILSVQTLKAALTVPATPDGSGNRLSLTGAARSVILRRCALVEASVFEMVPVIVSLSTEARIALCVTLKNDAVAMDLVI